MSGASSASSGYGRVGERRITARRSAPSGSTLAPTARRAASAPARRRSPLPRARATRRAPGRRGITCTTPGMPRSARGSNGPTRPRPLHPRERVRRVGGAGDARSSRSPTRRASPSRARRLPNVASARAPPSSSRRAPRRPARRARASPRRRARRPREIVAPPALVGERRHLARATPHPHAGSSPVVASRTKSSASSSESTSERERHHRRRPRRERRPERLRPLRERARAIEIPRAEPRDDLALHAACDDDALSQGGSNANALLDRRELVFDLGARLVAAGRPF